jgi:hypothetical protein
VSMANLAKKQLRKKIPQLQPALEGCLLPHHRGLLRDMIEDLDHVGAADLYFRLPLPLCEPAWRP